MKYPDVLEQWWLAEMRRIVTRGNDDKARLDWMQRHVASLSDLFTIERADGIGDYYKDPLRSLSYGLFYFPQTFLRMSHVLRELTQREIPFPERSDEKPLRILDIGAGLGGSTFSLAMNVKARAELTVLDHSASGLSTLSRIAGDLKAQWQDIHFNSKTGDLSKPDSWHGGPWDVIACSFALNEAFESADPGVWQEWIRSVLLKLSDDGILLLLEPALSETSIRLQEMRDFVLKNKLAHVAAPCCHQAAPCPLLSRREFWCHEARKWEAPESLRYLDRKLFRATDALKFSFLVLTKGDLKGRHSTRYDTARLVAPIRELKGRLTTFGCAADGALHAYEVQTRELSKPEKKDFLKTERGDIVRWHEVLEVGDQKILRAKKMEPLVAVKKSASDE